MCLSRLYFFFQAEDGIRDLVRSRGLGDVYKRQVSIYTGVTCDDDVFLGPSCVFTNVINPRSAVNRNCLLYTSDAADERSSVDLGGRRIIKKKNRLHTSGDVIKKYKTNKYYINSTIK